MKKIIFFLIHFSICISSFGQQPGIQWQKSPGSSTTDIANCVQQTSDGGYIVLGQTYNTNNGDVTGNNGSWDYWLVKLNNTGTIQWQKCYGGTTIDQGMSVKQTSDGGYILSGLSTSFDGDINGHHSSYDYWIVKTDASGIIQWEKSLGGSGVDNGYEITPTTDGGYIVAGQSISNNGDVSGNHGLFDYWLVKLNATGTIQWQKSLGGSGQDYGNSVQQTSDGGYIIGGFSNSNNGDVSGNNGNYDYWLVKLNSSGTLQWQKSLGGSADDRSFQTKQTTDGGYVMIGYTSSLDSMVTNSYGDKDVWVIKLNSFGILQWQKSLGGSGADAGNSVYQTSDGGYVITGYSNSTDGQIFGNQGADDCWVTKLNASGVLLWQKSLGGSADDIGNCILQTTDGGYIIAGQSQSNNGDVFGNHGGDDYWIVKLDPTTGMITNKNQPALSVFPNPSSGKFAVNGLTGENKIDVSDISGRMILQAVSHEQNSTIDLSAFENGIYFYTITGDNKYSGKLIKN